MEGMFSALTRAVEGAPLIAIAASLLWGILSIVLSPCHLASIPLIVGFVDRQGQEQSVHGPGEASREEGLPRLQDFGMGTCTMCKMMMPVLDEVRRDCAGTLVVEYVNIAKDPEKGKRHGISQIPCQIFYDPAGHEIHRHEHFVEEYELSPSYHLHNGLVLVKVENGKHGGWKKLERADELKDSPDEFTKYAKQEIEKFATGKK